MSAAIFGTSPLILANNVQPTGSYSMEFVNPYLLFAEAMRIQADASLAILDMT
jgi:hypothetical protein